MSVRTAVRILRSVSAIVRVLLFFPQFGARYFGGMRMEPTVVVAHGTDWAVVWATIFGPVIAVAISLWNEARAARRNRRNWVFSTLMGTRASPYHGDHVRALNNVLVEFPNDEDVLVAWRAYLTHLNPAFNDANANAWAERRRDLLATLLIALGSAVGFKKLTPEDVKYGSYAPAGWDTDSQRSKDATQFFVDLSNGEKSIPVTLRNPPP
jgi:uncharacterized protein DUF6680